jgi:hypothetical protein
MHNVYAQIKSYNKEKDSYECRHMKGEKDSASFEIKAD